MLSLEQRNSLRFSFWGSSYAPKGQATEIVLPVARQYGLEDICFEQPLRIPYFEALQLLRDADVLLLIGSEEQQYSPSKLYPYLLADKPIATFTPAGSALSETLIAYDYDVDFGYNLGILQGDISLHTSENKVPVPNIYTASKMASELGTILDQTSKNS